MTWLSHVSSGPVLLRTNYWQTAEARRGLLCLSSTHETVRVLVPPASEHMLTELPPLGTLVELRRGTHEAYASIADFRAGIRTPFETYRLTWLSDPPHVIEIDLRQSDRRWHEDEDGTVAALVWYTAVGQGEEVQERRRELIQIGDVVAS